MTSAFDVYDAIALTIYANDGEISNRTTIQKLIYFHTTKLKTLSHIPYSNHFYGPFSYAVASALDEMTAFSYLNERVALRYNHESYHYTLTDQGQQYAKYAEIMFPTELKSIDETITICKNYCDLTATTLSYSAKAHYILNNTENSKYTTKDVQKAAEKFGWEISGDDIKTGMELLEKLDLDKTA